MFELEPTWEHLDGVPDIVERLRTYMTGELAEYESDLGLGPTSRYGRDVLQPVWKRSRELGFYGIHLPAEHGGQDLSFSQLAALKEEVGASGRVLYHSVLGDMGGPLRAGVIFEHATPQQLETYLVPVVEGDRACCFSLTEPQAGSDVRAMTTTAESVEGGWRLTGTKVFSSAGPFADFAIVIARMGDDHDQYSAFLVDLDSPGCTVKDGELPMSGQYIESDIELQSCFVPAENLLGEVGEGLRIGLGRITANRLLHCPTLLGHTRRVIQLTVDFVHEREVFGGTLADLQSIQHKIAEMCTTYYAARAMTFDALAALDEGRKPTTEAFMCKLFVAEEAFKIADAAVQIHGKAGMVVGSEIEWMFRRLRMFRVLTGSSEIQKNGIARRVLAGPEAASR